MSNDKTTTIDQSKHVCGYTRVGVEEGDGSYGAGYSMYSAAWPLLKEYPGHDFQSGLFGSWMFADTEKPDDLEEGVWFYSDIEGGLGWWRDTEYPTETPKFIMGAVALGFCAWANGPGAGKTRDWSEPCGKYGVAQLSPNLLWPPDGVNMKQGCSGELLGSGYLPMPLTNAKETTLGAPVPTGDQCWTLFLNAANFKGPATFVLPLFFSEPSIEHPKTAGLFLDSQPSNQNRHHAMETQYIPWAMVTATDGRRFGRLGQTLFPADENGSTVVLHQLTTYNKAALWDRVKAWFDGGEPADSRIDTTQECRQAFSEKGGMGWGVWEPGVDRNSRPPLAADSFIRPCWPDPYSLAYEVKSDLMKQVEVNGQPYLMLPEYYEWKEDETDGEMRWVAIDVESVPKELGLESVDFSRPEEPPPQVYVTPEEPDSCWKTPGPVAGPFTAYPGDGSEVTYYWYRFADQPAMLNADLTDAELEEVQQKVEKLHAHWTKDKDYLAPPATGELAEIDPALIVTPPEGLEIGYVPIVTRQGPASS